MTEMADRFLISTTKNTTSIRQMFKKKKTINEIRDDAEMRGIYHKGTTTVKYTFTLRAQGQPMCEAAGCLLLRDTNKAHPVFSGGPALRSQVLPVANMQSQ